MLIAPRIILSRHGIAFSSTIFTIERQKNLLVFLLVFLARTTKKRKEKKKGASVSEAFQRAQFSTTKAASLKARFNDTAITKYRARRYKFFEPSYSPSTLSSPLVQRFCRDCAIFMRGEGGIFHRRESYRWKVTGREAGIRRIDGIWYQLRGLPSLPSL